MTNMLARNFISTMRAMRNSLSRYQAIRPTPYTVHSGKAIFSHFHQNSVGNTTCYDIEGKDVWEGAVGNEKYDALYSVHECTSGVITIEDEVVVKIPIAAVKESKEMKKFEWSAPVIWKFASGLDCSFSEVVKSSWFKLVEDSFLELNVLWMRRGRRVESEGRSAGRSQGRARGRGEEEEREPWMVVWKEMVRLGREIKPERDSDSDGEEDDGKQARSSHGDMRPLTRSRPDDGRESRSRGARSRGDDRRSASRSDPQSRPPEVGRGDDRRSTQSRESDEDRQRRERDGNRGGREKPEEKPKRRSLFPSRR